MRKEEERKREGRESEGLSARPRADRTLPDSPTDGEREEGRGMR